MIGFGLKATGACDAVSDWKDDSGPMAFETASYSSLMPSCDCLAPCITFIPAPCRYLFPSVSFDIAE